MAVQINLKLCGLNDMNYQVLALKWRPQNFTALVGQERVLAALVHGLNEDRLHHAYLFTGTRGVGKTTAARILAKCLNCEVGISATPCEKCESCIEIKEGRFIDLVEIDAASRTKVEDTRELLDNIQYAPSKGRFKVYLIDEVHMLSTHSFNALLKTLEEPPQHVKFLLATTDPHKLPVTVLSRCLQFHLKNIGVEEIISRLEYILNAEKISFDYEALKALAKAAEGSLRDALSLTDQAISQGGGSVKADTTLPMLGVVKTELLYQLAESIINQDAGMLYALLDQITVQGVDYGLLLKLFAEFWYEISLKQLLPTYHSTDINIDNEAIAQLAESLSPTLIQLFYDMALQGKKDIPFAPEPRIGFNMTLIRMLAFRLLEITDALPVVASVPKKSQLAESKSASKVNTLVEKELQKQVISPNPRDVSHAPLPLLDHQTMSGVPPIDLNRESAQPVVAKSEKSDKISLQEWEKLLNALPLTGMLKQIFKHTYFEHCEKNIITLSISKNHITLLGENVKNKFLEQLQNYYEQTFSLQIMSSDAPVNSPAAKANQQHSEYAAQLQEKLSLDSNIDFIKNNFNAKITTVKQSQT